MLKTHKEYVYAELTDSVINSAQEYVLAPSDIIQFRMFDNNGYRLLETGITAGEGGNTGMGRNFLTQNTSLNYLIDKDSTVDLPEIRRVKLAGLSIRKAQDKLESIYGQLYEKPYVQITVVNKRVIVFPGNGSDAQVVTLSNNNTTLLEALAYAGGVADRGRARNIKLMRNVGGTRYVYEIDLSTIEGLKYTDMLVQANDYIYVEPVPEIGREILADIAPVVSLLSSAIVLYTVFNTFSN